jgi:hypothetical protein
LPNSNDALYSKNEDPVNRAENNLKVNPRIQQLLTKTLMIHRYGRIRCLWTLNYQIAGIIYWIERSKGYCTVYDPNESPNFCFNNIDDGHSKLGLLTKHLAYARTWICSTTEFVDNNEFSGPGI